jgi:uncharacterized protein
MLHKSKEGLNNFFRDIYMWMFVGLLISAGFSYLTIYQGIGLLVFSNPILYYGLIAIQLILLFGVQLLINTFSVRASYFLYFLYTAVTGILLAGIFLIYTINSLILIFIVSAILFLSLAIIGYTTKKDLSSWGTVLYAGMIGVFVSSLINMVLQNSMLDTIVSAIAILVFCGLTVYDNQAYKKIYYQSSKSDLGKYVVLGALHMYINFIMIFINLLKFFGARR